MEKEKNMGPEETRNNYFVDWGIMGDFVRKKIIEEALKEGAVIVFSLKEEKNEG